MMWFSTGVGVGVLMTIPIVMWAARRTAHRVRKLERRAQTAERLAQLGTLTGGLAHEIKNPLSTVGLNVQLLQEDLRELDKLAPADSPIHEGIGRIQRRFDTLMRETRRLREILEDFLRFAGRMKLELAPADVHKALDELIDFFAPQANASQINLRTQFQASPAEVPLDINLFKQAVLNLFLNANHAMTRARKANVPHGGCSELIIRTERGGSELLIHVIDTGPGIDEKTLTRIFEPYFSTTKGGTGLGLPTTRRIVEEHGGHITCHSEVGRGTDFTITLPLTAKASPTDAADT